MRRVRAGFLPSTYCSGAITIYWSGISICCAMRCHPFVIDAWVVLPEHMHCVWTLPPGETAYSMRWRLIKTLFCRALPPDEYRSRLRLLRGERGIWQRRYWEYLIRDDEDFRRHVDYVHINPLKHGLVGPAFCKVVVASAVFFMPLFSVPVAPSLG
jgi:REP element-mobilizing transposase RayT